MKRFKREWRQSNKPKKTDIKIEILAPCTTIVGNQIYLDFYKPRRHKHLDSFVWKENIERNMHSLDSHELKW